jgi:hypothetical protein
MKERGIRKYTGRCCDCGGLLELVELDIEKGMKTMRCMDCNLVHFYKK